MKLLFFWILLISSQSTYCSTPKPGSVFVHLFEWKWKDIAKECTDFLGPYGYDAVQVSPPNEHIMVKDFPWFQRYQPVSYKLESRSGNEAEFKEMIQICKQAGVKIYVDAVINHMTAQNTINPELQGSAGTFYGHYIYQGVYGFEDFHHCGRNHNDDILNYMDRFEVQNCELGNLADLKTEDPFVQKSLTLYLQRLIDMGVKGFRIDAAKHIPANDLKSIFQPLTGNPFIYQEVIAADAEPIKAHEYFMTGAVTEFKYHSDLGHFFMTGKLDWFNNNRPMGEEWGYQPSSNSVVFIDNHDTQRVNGTLSHENKIKYKLANVFMLAWPYGRPQVMSSYFFTNPRLGPPADTSGSTRSIYGKDGLKCTPENNESDPKVGWVCEHRWKAISSMVKFRQITADRLSISNWWSNGNNQIAFSRGNKGFVIINNEAKEIEKVFKTSLPAGTYRDIINREFSIVVDANGNALIKVGPFNAAAFHI